MGMKKERTLRFNLEQCEQPAKATCFQQKKSPPAMKPWKPGVSQISHDSRSMACTSENISEHYVRAKKFAAMFNRQAKHPKP